MNSAKYEIGDRVMKISCDVDLDIPLNSLGTIWAIEDDGMMIDRYYYVFWDMESHTSYRAAGRSYVDGKHESSHYHIDRVFAKYIRSASDWAEEIEFA